MCDKRDQYHIFNPSPNYAIVAASFNRLTFLTRIQLCHPSLLFPPAPLTSRAKAKTGKLSLTFIASASTKLSRLLQARQTGSNNGKHNSRLECKLNDTTEVINRRQENKQCGRNVLVDRTPHPLVLSHLQTPITTSFCPCLADLLMLNNLEKHSTRFLAQNNVQEYLSINLENLEVTLSFSSCQQNTLASSFPDTSFTPLLPFSLHHLPAKDFTWRYVQ